MYKELLEEQVKERTVELEEKNAELERMNDLFVGREFRIKECIMPGKNLKMLIIEDDQVDQMAFERFVKKENLPYDYIVAGSVSEAEVLLGSNIFDIVITDYMLGDGTGLELFERMQDLPVIVVTSTDSAKALEHIRSDPRAFDLVVTDMTMPHMTGDALARKVMQIRPDLPVILCTGFSSRINENKAIEMGIRAFVSKPILRADLARTVRKVLDDRADEC